MSAGAEAGVREGSTTATAGGEGGGVTGSKGKASLGVMPEDCVLSILKCCDALGLAQARASNKKVLQKAGDEVVKAVVEHVKPRLYDARFVAQAKNNASENEALWRMTRDDADEVLVMGGWLGGKSINDIFKMTIKHQDGSVRFEEQAPMLQERSDFATSYQRGEVFAISTDQEYPHVVVGGTVERFDVVSQIATQMQANLPAPLQYPCSATIDGKLVVIGGGYNNEFRLYEYSNKMYMLQLDQAQNATHGEWIAHTATLNTPRHSAAAIEYHGKLYLCGGFAGDLLSSVEIFDFASGVWRPAANMNKARSDFSLCIYEDEIYACGGDFFNQTTTIEKLDKNTEQWTMVTDSLSIRKHCSAVLAKDRIYLLGGGGGAGGNGVFGGGGSNQLHHDHRTTYDYFNLRTKKWASQDASCKHKEASQRMLPKEVFMAKAVNITPNAADKRWTSI